MKQRDQGKVVPSIAKGDLFAFVLMPFSKEFDDVYRIGIQETARKKGVLAVRVDEQIYSETILEQICRQIDAADFVIADMTGRNPNVFYEVGYAHAKGKITTLITRTTEDIPFDLKHHRHIIYNGSIVSLVDQLEREIDWIKAEIERRKTNTFEIAFYHRGAILEVTEFERKGSAELVFDIHNRTNKRSPEIDAVYLLTSDKWEVKQDDKVCAHTNSDHELVTRRHILGFTTKRLAPGAWMQIKCEINRIFWFIFFDKGIPLDEYRAKGFVMFEIATEHGPFFQRIEIDLTFEEIPF